jgi:hypothetical protein
MSFTEKQHAVQAIHEKEHTPETFFFFSFNNTLAEVLNCTEMHKLNYINSKSKLKENILESNRTEVVKFFFSYLSFVWT